MGRMVPAAPTITLFRIAMGAPLKCRTKGETKAQSPKAPTIQLPTIICSISSARQREYAAIRRPTATSSQRAPWIPRYSRTNGAMTNHTPSVKFIQHRAFIDVTYFRLHSQHVHLDWGTMRGQTCGFLNIGLKRLLSRLN